MNNKSRHNKSICEKSMKLMTNIVKVSYISMARVGFRTGSPTQSLARATPYNRAPSFARYPKNLRSPEPKAVSYLIHPGDTNRSSMNVVKEDNESVDKEAGDFINKVREKNFKDTSEITNLSEFTLPPPPRFMLQSSAAKYKCVN